MGKSRRMRVLLWHGYLLSGSGSNLYTANIARVFRQQGHDVVLLCQERDVQALEFIDRHGDFSGDNKAFDSHAVVTQRVAGRCTLLRPNIGRILPVYVYDEYEGFTAKRFVDLSDDELDHYTNANVEALATIVEHHRPEAFITGHEVMGPYIALKACERLHCSYVAKLHGSALEYAVKLQSRYRRYAQKGLGGAKVVAGGSRYMIEEASRVVPGWKKRAVVVNPGCDVELFKPRPAVAPDRRIPIVGYVGKLIFAKGVHHLLAALPLVPAELQATVVGYGEDERLFRELWSALQRGDFESTRRSFDAGGDAASWQRLLSLLSSSVARDGYIDRARRISLSFAGRLDHGPLAKLLPAFDVLVVPSVVPEAFGMVAVEAASCGVLPLVPRHSGIGEIGATLEAELGVDGLLTYQPRAPIEGIASSLDRILALSHEERTEVGLEAAALARRRWSWEHVAERLLELATGAGRSTPL